MSGPPALRAATAVPDGVGMVGVAVGPDLAFDGVDAPSIDAAELAARGFKGRAGDTCVLGAVVAVGIGPASDIDADVLRRAGAALVRASWRRTSVAMAVPAVAALDPASAARAVAEGAALAAYRFTRFKSDVDPCLVDEVTVVTEAAVDLEPAAVIAEAVYLARDLVNTPAGSLTPSDLAAVAVEQGERAGITVEVFDEAAAVELRLGGLLGVAAGSDQPPCLLKLTYTPPEPRGTLALVGKGITFDSGGLSLKTADGMMTMKTDMGGAAAVVAAMCALPRLAPSAKVVAFVPATENMPGGRATKPGDVLTTRSGTTVEVLNTDAEGRLVLADGLALAVEEGVDAVVDLATLTGACMVALGPRIAGLFGTSPGLVDQVQSAADRVGERLWPMPMPVDLRAQLDSDVADIKNVSDSRHGGALLAALFLKDFVADVPWAHLDIAGPVRADADDGPHAKGATGFGVRTLVQLVQDFDPARL